MQSAMIGGSKYGGGGSNIPTDENASVGLVENHNDELEKLKRDHLNYIDRIECYKRQVTYAVIAAFLAVGLAVTAIAWKFSSVEPTYEELRAKILSTPKESPRLCVTLYPNSIKKDFKDIPEVGEPLTLTPYIERREFEKAADLAAVKGILQSEKSFAGYFTVNKTFNSNLFFWFFPAKLNADKAPLVLWLQGGPGWPTMYGLFKENGPYLVGWDSSASKTFMLHNKHSWTANHNMLYIDNPVGTGFSFTNSEEGFPTTDEEIADGLLNAVLQFDEVLPYFIPGMKTNQMPFFAFGESYGGAYVISLAHVYLKYRELNPTKVTNLRFDGIGVGNGFVSAIHQSRYADYVRSLGYLTEEQYVELSDRDKSLLSAISDKNYSDALDFSQKSLHYIVSEIMNLTNIYDFSFDDNFLTNHEYVCFLQSEKVRKAIHVGPLPFNSGFASYNYLNETIMVSKLAWLEEALEKGLEVVIYNGNMDIIVNVPGISRVIDALKWSGQKEFASSKRRDFWVWNKETERSELAGYVNEGGGLTFVLVRNAGHMVPISQPLRAWDLVTRFTHNSKGQDRWMMPEEMRKPVDTSTSFYNC